MKTSIKRVIIFGVIAVVTAAAIIILNSKGYTLESLLENREKLLRLVSENIILSSILFALTYLIVVAISIPGATLLTLLGGFLFGPILGVILINIGATTGAFIIFLVARYLLRDALMQKYGKQLAKLNKELEINGANYLLTLRFIPLFPFFLINLIAGLTPVSSFTYLWTTAVGIIPGSIVYTLFGSSGAELGKEGAGFPPQLIAALILLTIISLLPVVIRKYQQKKKASEESR